MDNYTLLIQRDGDYPLRLRDVPRRFDRHTGERLLRGARDVARWEQWHVETLDAQGGFVARREGVVVWVRIERVAG